MKQKVIAIIRTSTIQQEVEAQKNELINYILSDGVDRENIIIVGGAGASAIKVDEEYKKNMQTVYDLIENGNIKSVYAWAIDRIGRNEEILFSFKNYLVKHGVQLVIKNPSLRLLNEDGTVNNGVELAFSLYATMSQQEMLNKKERFARTKKRNTETGKFNGGVAPFGYMVDNNNNIIINDDESNIVKLIYSLYNSGEFSTTALAKELTNRGITKRGKVIRQSFINYVLNNTAYIGFTETNGIKRPYPVIISNELYNAVQDRLRGNKSGDITKQSKHISICAKLIVCQHCGAHYMYHNNNYICAYNHNALEEKCESIQITAKWVDIAALAVAKTCELDFILNNAKNKAEEAAETIEVNKQKISVLKAKINGIEDRKKRVADNYEFGLISEVEMRQNAFKIKEDLRQYNNQIAALKEENERLKVLINETDDGILIRTGRLTVSGLTEDVEFNYKLTHKHIKKITVEKYEYNGKMQRLISIITIMGEVFEFLYLPKCRIIKNGFQQKLFYKKDGEFLNYVGNENLVHPL